MTFQRLFLFFSILISPFLHSQTKKHLIKPGDSLDKVAFVNTVEQSLKMYLADMAKKYNSTELMTQLNYEANEIPTYSDEVYC
jgi:hypothetical protein